MNIAGVSDRGSLELTHSTLVAQTLPKNDGQFIFGLHLSHLEPASVAHMLLCQRREAGSGVGMIATANIQHIALMRKDVAFREALESADLVTCDGFPIFWYARHIGYAIEGRTTGREIVANIMEVGHIAADHRMFFLVDGDQTAEALYEWAEAKGVSHQLMVEVPPLNFIENDAYCRKLSDKVSAFDTTLFFLCTGAPQSEVYSHRYRSLLPDCWALCVGQSAKLALGLTPPPPKMAAKLNLEWLWRIALEPRRMLKRYLPSAVGFLAAISEDTRNRAKARS